MSRYLTFVRGNLAFLAAGMLLTFCSSFGQTFFVSIFSGEIRAAFGLSHGAWGAIYSAGTFAAAVAMIWAGVLTDRFRVRAMGAVMLPCYAVACLAMGFNVWLWAVPILVFALRFFGQGMATHIATVAMARWFVATRGRALSTATLGFALGEAVLPVSFVALMLVLDWRFLWVLSAGLLLALTPVLWRLLSQERTPQSQAAENQSAGMEGLHWTRRAVLRHWLFWFIVPILLGPAAFSTAFFFHQVHFAETKAFSHLALVALFPLFTGSAVVTMMVSGFLIDRFGTARLMPLYQVPMVAAFLVLSGAGGVGGAAIGMVLLAMTVGANHTLPSAFWAEFYGTRHLGAVRAMAAAVMVLGTAIGPVLTGALIDAGTSFDAQMIGIAGYFALACLSAAIGVGRARPLLARTGEIDVIGP